MTSTLVSDVALETHIRPFGRTDLTSKQIEVSDFAQSLRPSRTFRGCGKVIVVPRLWAAVWGAVIHARKIRVPAKVRPANA